MLRVRGGPAGSGTRIIRQASSAWTCVGCGNLNKGYHVRCMTPGCNKRRTDAVR